MSKRFKLLILLALPSSVFYAHCNEREEARYEGKEKGRKRDNWGRKRRKGKSKRLGQDRELGRQGEGRRFKLLNTLCQNFCVLIHSNLLFLPRELIFLFFLLFLLLLLLLFIINILRHYIKTLTIFSFSLSYILFPEKYIFCRVLYKHIPQKPYRSLLFLLLLLLLLLDTANHTQ